MKVPSIDEITKAYSRFVPHEFLQLLGKENVAEVALGESVEKK
jgi:hypothetical protein